MLSWGWAAVGLWLLFVMLERYRRGVLLRFGDKSLLSQMMSSLDRRRRFAKQMLLVASFLLVVLSLARPQLPGNTVLVKKKGIDIVICVDVSMSMLAQDISPNRLTKAKLELQEFVDKAKGDRIGVVAFAGEALVQVPLTVDREAVKLYLKALDPSNIPTPGTALENAIRTAGSLFTEREAKGKVIVLLTDGEDLGSDPIKAAKIAAKDGIRIYTIGIGTPEGDRIPMRLAGGKIDFKKDVKGKLVVSRLGEETLKGIAEETAGAYYRAARGALNVDRIYRDVHGLGQTETSSDWVVEYKPLYPVFLLAAVILLMIEMWVSETVKP